MKHTMIIRLSMLAARRLSRSISALSGAAVMGAALLGSGPAAAVDLADSPVLKTQSVPGNLVLALSVEWPTATAIAYPSTDAYVASDTYLGYFDPAKCYRYNYNPTAPLRPYFEPKSISATHTCVSTSLAPRWSGNYLNWATMQTLDIFRWVLTGGYRSVDDATQTILTKTYAARDSASSMPDKTITTTTTISGATPFNWTSSTTRLRALGTSMYLYQKGGILDCSVNTSSGTVYSCNTTSGTQSCTGSGGSLACTKTIVSGVTMSCSRTSGTMASNYVYTCDALDASSAVGGRCRTAAGVKTCSAIVDYDFQSYATSINTATVYKMNVDVKVCDSTVGRESNCVQYGSNYKPEGLLQRYSSKLRYSAFGYYNHSGDTTQQRDGGVMRARMKYIGPTKPVPGSADIANTATEWSATTGIMVKNPDPADASATVSDASSAGWTVSIVDSGVMNYLNKFGNTALDYKSKDPVSELYYAALRYLKNQGNVSSYSSLAGATSSAVASLWLDGFPAITTWDDPIAYSCQKNFILGIGDVNTHRDANVPGSTLRAGSSLEPAQVADSTGLNAATATDMVGKLEGFSGSLGSVYLDTENATCPNTGSRCDTYYLAGLAYDAHTNDIRTDASMPGVQTVSTYWMDVLENQLYMHKNQYWLAAKYGGFTIPAGFSPYAATNNTSSLPLASWYSNTDVISYDTGTAGTLAYSTDTAGTTGVDKRPDNYFTGDRPEAMQTGLTNAFDKIAAESEKPATSTGFATASSNCTSASIGSFSARYDPSDWSGQLRRSSAACSGDDSFETTVFDWDARTQLELAGVTASTRKIITCCTSAGAALPFTTAAMTAATLHSRTYYASFSNVPGVAAGSQSASNFLEYMRGDHSKEIQNGGAYRNRTYRLGDIVNSKPVPVEKPNGPYFDADNAGYSSFKAAYANRTPVVYVGANDGMLHAFDATAGQANSGKELWAYIPSFVYGSASTASSTGLVTLGNPSFTHHYFVDAKPVLADVDLNKTVGASTSTPNWRSLLIGGLGKGGKGYYAIDVTDPSSWTTEANIAAKVLWEFTDSRMGYSYAPPVVAKTAKYGWVVILTSGYNNSDGVGYIFFVNPRTGALLAAVATPEGSLAAPIDLGPPSAFVPSFRDGTIDSLYVGDMVGNMWRMDLTGTGTYSAPIKFARLVNASGAAQSITTRPLIEVGPETGKRYVLFGSGRLLADTDIADTSVQSFYAIIDGTGASGGFSTSASLPAGVTFPITRSKLEANTNLANGISSAPTGPMGWYFDLPTSSTGVASRVNVPAETYTGRVIFAGNLPTGTTCNWDGTNSIYGVDFETGKAVIYDSAGNAALSGGVGLVIDLGIFRDLNGGINVISRTDQDCPAGQRCKYLLPSAPSPVKQLNWREVPIAD